MAQNSAVSLNEAFNTISETLSLTELSLNSVFFYILLAIAIFALSVHFHGKKLKFLNKCSKFVSVAPTMLTGIGILGTFLGILVGLGKAFSPELETGDEIENLVIAMKFAFVTSIIGMFFALIVRFASLIPNSNTEEESPKTAEDFLNLVQSIRNNVSKSATSNNKNLAKIITAITGDEDSTNFLKLIESIKDSINKASKNNDNNFAKVITAISGDGDSALASQVRLLRSEENDNHKKLRNEFSSFAKKMSENNSKSLIKALEEVMRDFNAKINEHLGDNFKELNKAVGSLLQWQDNYKEQITTMEQQFKRCTDSIKKVEKAMISIKESTDAIPEAMEKLPEIVAITTDSLQAFADMKEQAIAAFPVIEDNLQKLTVNLENQINAFELALTAQQGSYENLETSFNGLGKQAESVMEALSVQMKESMQVQQLQMEKVMEAQQQQMKESMQAQQLQMQKISEEFSKQMKGAMETHQASYKKLETSFGELSDKSQSVIEGLNSQMKETMEAQQKKMKEITDEFSAQMKEGIKKSVDNSIGELQELFSGFNGQMEEQLKSVLENMGSHLASLSQKFVDDYTPLTTKLQEVVNMAKGVDNENR